jgi:hypothetical protein
MNMNPLKSAQVHRFGDNVAAYVTGQRERNGTVYMTPKEARALARALNKAARSCKNETFTANTVGTIVIQGSGQ